MNTIQLYDGKTSIQAVRPMLRRYFSATLRLKWSIR